MATTQYRVRLTGEERVVEAWAAARNATVTPILCTFSLADARTRLAYAYPSLAGEEDMMPWTRYRAGVSSTGYRFPPPTLPCHPERRCEAPEPKDLLRSGHARRQARDPSTSHATRA